MIEDTSSSKWLPEVICAFQAAGGTARFPQIYRWIQLNRKGLPDEWRAAVRATVYHHSADSPVFKKGSPDVFFKKAYGLWALRHPSETVRGKTDKDLVLQIVTSMTKEELESSSGRGDAFLAHITQQVEELKSKFKLE